VIKLNQIGSVTETIDNINMCRKAGWGYVISHRSGETEDDFMPTSRVAMAAARIKTALGMPQRAHLQVQPPAGDRGGAGQRRYLRK